MALPRWKVRRELTRVLQQLQGAPELVTDWLQKRLLDRAVARGLPTHEGDQPLTDKVAILLVFQPNGVLQSTLDQCDWLVTHGYTPLIVSNSPLKPDDLSRLKPVTWRTVERPNFGYDFGGYRDAMTVLAQWQITPETLLILNDSVWVPLNNQDLLGKLEANPADIAGSILRIRGETRFLESYCYRIRGNVMASEAFQTFWNTLRLTSNKYYVIRRGERGFSEAMQAAGFNVQAIYDQDVFLERLAQQDDDFLRKTLTYASFLIAELEDERTELLASSDNDWRSRVFALINKSFEKRLAYSALPYAHHHLMDYPFMKKSKDPVSTEWRKAYWTAVQAGDLPEPSETIYAELNSQLRPHRP